jgi:hypothetical protein
MSELIVATGQELVRLKAHGRWQASKLSSGRGMQCLVADPRNPDVFYASSRGEGVWMNTGRSRELTTTTAENCSTAGSITPSICGT